ncbi:MAG TPA: sulfur carrier protein ThiS [Dissulfurispiraceae bacterium]|nr:sulfur carrier protein ThiS [Dissulfurispiraceae bacterium]
MKLILNGEPHETSQKTVNGLLAELAIQPERVAVEVNLAIIRRVEFDRFQLNDGDAVEIVNFVGGG